MAEITASMVMELRERTGLGMMECKKALTETGGDMAKAEELLRIKSGAKASKAADRVAAEGVIGATIVGRRQDRRAGRSQLRDRFCRQERGFRRRSRASWPHSSRRRIRPMSRRWSRCRWTVTTVEAARQALVQKIGENISRAALRRASRRQARWRSTCTAARIGVHGRRSRAATRRPARTWRCTSPRASPACGRCACRASRCRRS